MQTRHQKVLNKIQGSYVFMDADYCRNYGEDGSFFRDFQQSLFVLTTVQSVVVRNSSIIHQVAALELHTAGHGRAAAATVTKFDTST